MANVQLNVFESFPILHRASGNSLLGNGSLNILGVVLPGSISFNNIAVFKTIGNVTNTMSITFGLYSLNGASLSLANSASQTNTMRNGGSWITMVTSANQNITPGNWFFAFMWSTSSNQPSLLINGGGGYANGAHGGFPIRGYMSVSTAALPAAIATSDISKESASGVSTYARYPYIIISA